MTAKILDGRALAKTLREELRADVHIFAAEIGIQPRLVVVRVDGDPAAERYSRTICKGCADVGIRFDERLLPADVAQAALEQAIDAASADAQVSGILLHMPLPAGRSAADALLRLDPRKDVDGIHPYNAGLLLQGRPYIVPNTPAGGMQLLRHFDIDLAGKRAVVVGRSAVVGKPMALLLTQADATVTLCHSKTRDLAAAVREAEIVVAAAGRPGLITGAMLRTGAVVVDFGINVLDDGRLVGDVDFESAAEVAGAITPVPGGTGRVTNVMLLRNVLHTARTVHAPG